ncbi:citramalate synthase [Paenibacillus albiflavus]|uniref:Citramalate synthase n=1 Tax=Paenibacillus albiflavus TaxID=2545760 RepID=A0A4R4E3Z8_9BACL|nr:citramalate synthase [Paenibacillus albiflavus]TCZ74276.1 citramalate synthase [Paenibacillus albiflavus]
MESTIQLFDTTLRDGTQGEGVSLSVEDKLKIAKKLDELGIHYIEGGWPGSNSKDIEFFNRVQELHLKHAKIAAFGSTRRKESLAEQDANLLKIVDSGAQVASIFGKSWDFHVHTAIQTTLEENLAMVSDSVAFLKRSGLEVLYLGEHFFDGYKSNPEYALQTIAAAQAAGADAIVLCDTNGGSLPDEVYSIVSAVKEHIHITIGIHAHNDCDLGVANTLAAVKAGATHVQGTFNGYGERCGNANLSSIIPNLQIKLGYSCVTEQQLMTLTPTARYISEIANMSMPVSQPYVGMAAFAHKGGIHVSAILKDATTYEHIIPEKVGNKQRVLVSELAGQSNLMSKALELGIDLDQSNKAREVIQKIKELEHEGFQFEGADASLELLLREAMGTIEESFTVESFKILVEKASDRGNITEAIVRIKVQDQLILTAGEGNGPVNALDNALRKALLPYYPDIMNVHLTDYKVRVLDEQGATAAKVRVLVESTDANNAWSTVGVSSNVIEASWLALVDSIRYALIGKQPIESLNAERERLGLVNH